MLMGLRVRPGDERTARYISGDRLPHYWTEGGAERALGATPTISYRLDEKRGTVKREPLNGPPPEGKLKRGASLVVIDDVSPAELRDPNWLRRRFEWLDLRNGQQTVWLIEQPSKNAEPTPADYDALVVHCARLIQKLAAETKFPGQAPRDLHIAIGTTHRHTPSSSIFVRRALPRAPVTALDGIGTCRRRRAGREEVSAGFTPAGLDVRRRTRSATLSPW